MRNDTQVIPYNYHLIRKPAGFATFSLKRRRLRRTKFREVFRREAGGYHPPLRTEKAIRNYKNGGITIARIWEDDKDYMQDMQ